jgi:hypothetical protein
MNNQNTNSEYSYINVNGRLVPNNRTTQQQRENTAKNTQQRPTQQRPTQQRPAQERPQPRTIETEHSTIYKANKDKKKGSKIKKLCLSLSLIMILSAAKQHPFHVNGKVTEVASKNANHSYMDEVFASDETIQIYNPRTGKTQKMQLEDAVNKLEDYIEITKLINSLNIDEEDYVELTEKERRQAIELYNEKGIEGVVALYKRSNGNNIEKARTARQLIFIRDYFGGEWIEKNGFKIVKALLEKTIQTGAIENYGTFNPLEYNVVEIPSENEFPYFAVTINDNVSGAQDEVFFTPIACGEYAQAMLLYRKLVEIDEKNLTPQEQQNLIEHTLRIIKKCINKDVENFHGVTYTK